MRKLKKGGQKLIVKNKALKELFLNNDAFDTLNINDRLQENRNDLKITYQNFNNTFIKTVRTITYRNKEEDIVKIFEVKSNESLNQFDLLVYESYQAALNLNPGQIPNIKTVATLLRLPENPEQYNIRTDHNLYKLVKKSIQKLENAELKILTNEIKTVCDKRLIRILEKAEPIDSDGDVLEIKAHLIEHDPDAAPIPNLLNEYLNYSYSFFRIGSALNPIILNNPLKGRDIKDFLIFDSVLSAISGMPFNPGKSKNGKFLSYVLSKDITNEKYTGFENQELKDMFTVNSIAKAAGVQISENYKSTKEYNKNRHNQVRFQNKIIKILKTFKGTLIKDFEPVYKDGSGSIIYGFNIIFERSGIVDMTTAGIDILNLENNPFSEKELLKA